MGGDARFRVRGDEGGDGGLSAVRMGPMSGNGGLSVSRDCGEGECWGRSEVPDSAAVIVYTVPS
jgi:hypothetical protein